MEETRETLHTRDLTYIALCAALIAVCSWIAIPGEVPFTLQTLGVFLTVGLLGGRRGTMAVVVYLLLGAVGLPVFANFTSGVGVLLGNTGGFFLGFVATALIMWALEHFFGRSLWVLGIGMTLGMIAYSFLGACWAVLFYAQGLGGGGWPVAFAWYVVPFVLPDLAKLALALLLTARLRRYVK